jgi:hypothetical protein
MAISLSYHLALALLQLSFQQAPDELCPFAGWNLLLEAI